MKSITRRAGALAAGAVVALLGLSACNNDTPAPPPPPTTDVAPPPTTDVAPPPPTTEAPPPSPTTQAPTAGGPGSQVSLFDIKPGHCLDYNDMKSAGSSGADVTLLDCASTHDAEVFAETQMTGDIENVEAETQAFCQSAFESYIGTSFSDSEFGLYYFFPTSGSYSMGDRLITCIIHNEANPWSGLAQGAAK